MAEGSVKRIIAQHGDIQDKTQGNITAGSASNTGIYSPINVDKEIPEGHSQGYEHFRKQAGIINTGRFTKKDLRKSNMSDQSNLSYKPGGFASTGIYKVLNNS